MVNKISTKQYKYKDSTDSKSIKVHNSTGTNIVQMVNKISTKQYKYKDSTDGKLIKVQNNFLYFLSTNTNSQVIQ